MLAGTLITQAYYLSGVVSRYLESVSGEQIADGVGLLNDVFSEINSTGRYAPYFSYPQITAVIGQEVYFIPNVIDIFTATFNIGPVRYEMYPDDLKHYYGASRVDNINALPFNWFWERVPGGINVSVYFLPQAAYILKFKCKVSLTDVGVNTDLTPLYDESYQLFLKYKLAEYICNFNKISLPPFIEKMLKKFENIYADFNVYDYSIKKISTIAIRDSLSYAQVNIGKGWE